MKKIILLSASAFLLVACSEETKNETVTIESSAETSAINSREDESVAEVESEKIDIESDPLVMVEELPYEIMFEEPDSSGSVYGLATYTNTSDYPVVSFDLTATLLDTNETTYYSTYDTVMPGETSAIFDSFGPETMSMEDLEIKEISYSIMLEDGSKQYIDYDTKLKKYDVMYVADPS